MQDSHGQSQVCDYRDTWPALPSATCAHGQLRKNQSVSLSHTNARPSPLRVTCAVILTATLTAEEAGPQRAGRSAAPRGGEGLRLAAQAGACVGDKLR